MPTLGLPQDSQGEAQTTPLPATQTKSSSQGHPISFFLTFIFPWFSGIILLSSSLLIWIGGGSPGLAAFAAGMGLGILAPRFIKPFLRVKRSSEVYPSLPLLPRMRRSSVEALKPQEGKRRQREREEERIRQISAILLALRRSLNAHAVLLFRRSPKEEKLYPELVESYDPDLEPLPQIPAGEGLIGYAFREARSILAMEVNRPLSGITYYPQPLPVHSFLAVPLIKGESCTGVLAADTFEVQAFTEDHRVIMELMAQEIHRLEDLFARYGEISEELVQWQAFFEVAQNLQDLENLPNITRYFLDLLKGTLNPDWVLFIVEESPTLLRVVSATEERSDLAGKGFPGEGGWVRWALHQPGMREISDLKKLPPHRYLLHPESDPIPRHGTLLCVPLGASESLSPSGVLLYSTRVDFFQSYERGIMQRLLAPFRLAYERQKAMEELRRLATTDSLTGLWNRRVGLKKLQEYWRLTQRSRNPLSLILFDVDRFKSVNDSYGHDIGDEVLRRVARVARTTLRVSDMVARYGGEEFLIILPHTDLKDARGLAERLRRRIAAETIPLPQGKMLRVTASLGVATLNPKAEIKSPEVLLKAADDALYRAKKQGRNRVEIAPPG